MEHEVNVPFPVGSVRAALAEPERVARCVPGLQPEGAGTAGSGDAKSTASTTEGRLRVRVGGTTITYRGSLTVTSDGGEFTVKGSGTEARGTGSVRLDLTVVPKPVTEGEGTRLVCSGTAEGDGRIADVERRTATAAGRRLLERFGRALGESIREEPPGTAGPAAGPDAGRPAQPPAEPDVEATATPVGGIGEPGDNDRVIPGIPGPDNRERASAEAPAAGAADAPAQAGPEEEQAARDQGADRAEGDERTGAGAEDGPAAAAEEAGEAGQPAGGSGGEPGDGERDGTQQGPARQGEGPQGPQQDEQQEQQQGTDRPGRESSERGGIHGTEVPPSSLDPLHDEPLDEAEVEAAAEAEAAHARRTMIGRSAEEVDHAPPRGRYAPVPVPEPIANSAALRWAAPAAAAVVAGAVVIGRVLRRRR